MQDKEYLIHYSPLRALIIFSLPMMLGNLFQQLYTMTDSVIVGRFIGEKALAAVGASYSLTSVFIAVAIGGGVGSSVLVSRAFGSRDYNSMKGSISTSLVSFLVLSLALALFGYIFSPQIMIALNTPADILSFHVQCALFGFQCAWKVEDSSVSAYLLITAECHP